MTLLIENQSSPDALVGATIDDYTITRPAFWIEKYGRDRDTILFAKHGTIKATPHKMEIPWPT
jgi:hypothetical protein